MASLCDDNGLKRILVVVDGERPAVRLGRVSAKQAQAALSAIEDLANVKNTGGTIKASTAEWLAALPDTIHKRVVRADLTQARVKKEETAGPTLGAWVSAYIAGRTDVKDGTKTCLSHAKRNLIAFFGEGKRLDAITEGDADAFRIALKEEKLSESTIRRRCKTAKQFFRAAVRKKILADNPFAEIATGNYANAERFYFVSEAEAQAVLDACPDAEWRLIFALCRYGGLRCPTEVLRLTWGDVDREKERFTVHASKTEHHDGGGIRVVPIFPELAPYLQDAFDKAETGAVNVITRYREMNQNLRTQLGRIIRKASLAPWPKLFQNLRSTRETELCETFPAHVVCKWLGNSQPVAAKHYLQVTEDHYRKAAQKAAHFPAQHTPSTDLAGTHTAADPANRGAIQPLAAACAAAVGPQGFEPWTKGL